jgi:hypothetical protein
MRYLSFSIFLLGLSMVIGGVARTAPAPQTQLWAPTYYIAAKATYDGRPAELHVVGASNLPSGARLYVTVYRYIGEGGDAINEGASTIVGKGGSSKRTCIQRVGTNFSTTSFVTSSLRRLPTLPNRRPFFWSSGSMVNAWDFRKTPKLKLRRERPSRSSSEFTFLDYVADLPSSFSHEIIRHRTRRS